MPPSADPSQSDLPLRQRQALDVLGDREMPTGDVAREMKTRYGVSTSSTYDVLGALHKKGLARIELRDEKGSRGRGKRVGYWSVTR